MISVVPRGMPYPVMPYGALCVAESLRRDGHEVKVLSCDSSKRSIRFLTQDLRRLQPEIIGLSIRNIDNADLVAPAFYLEEVKILLQAVRYSSGVDILAGGPGFSIAPAEILEFLDLQYGIAGEGERAMCDFVEFISAERAVNDVCGLVIRSKGEVLTNRKSAITYLDSCPMPDYKRIDVHAYLKQGGFFSIQTKRGCPYQCIYCSYPVIEGNKHRLRSPERVCDEIESVCRIVQKAPVFFVDSVFNAPVEHCRAVCEEMLKRNIKTEWCAYVNPKGVTRDLVMLMKKAGCIGVEIGLDVTQEAMLKRMGKGFSRKDIVETFEAFAGSGVPFSAFMLYGGPSHDESGLKEEIRFLDSLPQPNLLGFSFGIRIYPETRLANWCRSEGRISEVSDLLHPKFYLSPAFDEKLLRWFDRECSKRPTWHTTIDSSSAVVKALLFLTRKGGIRPYWKDSATYGKVLRRLNPFRRFPRYLRESNIPMIVPERGCTE